MTDGSKWSEGQNVNGVEVAVSKSGVHSPMAQILGQVEEYVGSSNV